MKISVIIPVYNSSKTILNTLEAILNQTFPISEVIIIDDRSKDDTILVIKKLIKSDRDQGVEIRLIEDNNLSTDVGAFGANATGYLIQLLFEPI